MASISLEQKAKGFDVHVDAGLGEGSRYLVLFGRILFSLIFVVSAFGHFQAGTVSYAVSQGVPYANLLVPFSGAMALVGGLCVATGFQARFGASLLIIFLIPVTLMMHAFWNVEDPMMRTMQMAHFMKNLSMLGAAMLILHYGAGPISIDAKRRGGKIITEV